VTYGVEEEKYTASSGGAKYVRQKLGQKGVSRQISFYYNEDSVVHYRETPLVTTAAFLSSLGGSLGLFLGASVLSALSFAIGYAGRAFNGGKNTI